MVIFFKRKKKVPEDSDEVYMITKVGDVYNFDGSSVYFSQASVTQLFTDGRWILES